MTDPSLSVIRGTLELLALRTLRSGQRLHGFEILECIHRTTEGELRVEEGALYPALHRMEKRGWLTSDWGVSEKGRKAKYYCLSAAGRDALAAEERRWRRYVDAMARMTESDPLLPTDS